MFMDPPDFDRLPAGTKEQFEQRLEQLPLHRLRTRIDFDAAWGNEYRFKDRFCAEYRLTEDDSCSLGTWHLNATHERLAEARPDLTPPRRHRLPRGHFLAPDDESTDADGHGITVQAIYRRNPGTRLDRLAWTFRRLQPNFTVGWGCWFGNRWSGVRGVRVDYRAAQFRRMEGS